MTLIEINPNGRQMVLNHSLPTYDHPVWRLRPMNAVRMATILANRRKHP